MLSLAAGALLAGTALPGTVTADPAGCPGAYCLWTKPDFAGKRLVIQSHKLINLPKSMNNKVSSVKIRVPIDKAVYLYPGKNGNGTPSFACGENDFPGLDDDNVISSTDVRSGEAC